jgi:glycosyltransferase involved in cell wall biosynthesis
MELISIILPTKNRSELLKKAITSVKNQTYINWELIIVDDGSSDNTIQVVEYFNDDRIIYERNKKSLGGAQSRNIGAKISNGSLLAFLDDDDEWLPEKLEIQLKHFHDSEVGLSYCGCLIKFTAFNISYPTKPSIEGEAFDELLINNYIGVTPSVVVRKSVFEKAGGFDPGLKAREDYDLWLRIAQISIIKCTDKVLFVSYQRDNIERITSSIKNYIDSDQKILAKYETYLAGKPKSFQNLVHKRHLEFIAGQAIKAGNKKNAKKFYLKSLAKRIELRTLFLYFLSFLPFKYILKLKSLSRK